MREGESWLSLPLLPFLVHVTKIIPMSLVGGGKRVVTHFFLFIALYKCYIISFSASKRVRLILSSFDVSATAKEKIALLHAIFVANLNDDDLIYDV